MDTIELAIFYPGDELPPLPTTKRDVYTVRIPRTPDQDRLAQSPDLDTRTAITPPGSTPSRFIPGFGAHYFSAQSSGGKFSPIRLQVFSFRGKHGFSLFVKHDDKHVTLAQLVNYRESCKSKGRHSRPALYVGESEHQDGQAIPSKSPSLAPARNCRHSSAVNLLKGPSGLFVLPIITNSPLRATFMHAPVSQVRETRQSRSLAVDAYTDI